MILINKESKKRLEVKEGSYKANLLIKNGRWKPEKQGKGDGQGSEPTPEKKPESKKEEK